MGIKDTFNNPEQDKALVKAVKAGDIVAIIDACKKGADPNVRDPVTGRNLLFTVMDQLDSEAGRTSAGSYFAHFIALTQHGGSGGLPDKDGLTPLHYSFERRNPMLASILLLQEGCAVNGPDPRTGDTPLHKALPLFLSPAEDIDTAPFDVLLIRGGDPLIPNAAGVTVMDMARAATGERARLALEKLMETPAVRQQALRDKMREKPLKLKTP